MKLLLDVTPHGGGSYFWKQWAAVRIQFLWMRVPPQTWMYCLLPLGRTCGKQPDIFLSDEIWVHFTTQFTGVTHILLILLQELHDHIQTGVNTYTWTCHIVATVANKCLSCMSLIRPVNVIMKHSKCIHITIRSTNESLEYNDSRWVSWAMTGHWSTEIQTMFYVI